MQHAQAIETARAVLDSSHSHADAVALALYVLSLKDIEGAFSPSASSCGGGFDPAAPASAPVSMKSDAASPARNLGAPSGACTKCGQVPRVPYEDCIAGAEVPGGGTVPHFIPKELPTERDVNRDVTNAATIPTICPTAGMSWQDEKIAVWLEGHAKGYDHGGFIDIAQVLRKKAMKVRRREYLEEKT